MKSPCRHDYKKAIKIGNVDYQCPLCGKVLDPLEWFLMNNFEFVDMVPVNKLPEQKTGKRVVTRKNFLSQSKTKKRIG